MLTVPNPIRFILNWISRGLARLGLVDAERGQRTVDLAWPRILTGLARMSKSAADVAMVGVALGPAAIAGVGFAGPYWGIAFTLGGGLASGTIALVSQRYQVSALDSLAQAVRSSVLLTVALSLPIAAIYWLFPAALIGLLSNDATVIRFGTTYLRAVAIGVPFAAVNLIGSRMLIGADDAWTPMVIRGGGAIANIGLNALFIFGLEMGVLGAALGTVLSSIAVTAVFAIGVTTGRIPGVGSLPITVSARGRYFDLRTIRDLLSIAVPSVGRRIVRVASRFPLLAIVALFGPAVVAAYVISRRVFMLLNTPGWGFSLAASSLVGQSLGDADEATAEAYGWEISRISIVTYVVVAAFVALFAGPIVGLFVSNSPGTVVPIGVSLVYAACVGVIPQGIGNTIAGALDATGDVRWPFYSQALGTFGVAIPVAYLGATTALGLVGLYFVYIGQTIVPAVVNSYRFSTGHWKVISRRYRPSSAGYDD